MTELLRTTAVGNCVRGRSPAAHELRHADEIVMQSRLTLTLQRDHPRDAVLRNVLVEQPGERFVGHIALAHQAARAIEAVEVAAGGDFYLREHKRPSFQARHESYPVGGLQSPGLTRLFFHDNEM